MPSPSKFDLLIELQNALDDAASDLQPLLDRTRATRIKNGGHLNGVQSTVAEVQESLRSAARSLNGNIGRELQIERGRGIRV